MAAKKQTQKKKTTSGKSKSTAAKPKTASQQTKKNTKSKSDERERPSKGGTRTINNQRVAIILFAVAAIFLAATFIKGEHIWLAFHNAIFGIFGICSYAWPLLLIYLAAVIASDRTISSIKGRLIGASLFTCLLSGIVHIFSEALDVGELGAQIEYVWDLREKVTVKSGGVIGALFGGVPELLFGKAASVVVLFVLLFVTIMFITGGTLLGIYLFFKERIDSRKQKKQDRRALEDSIYNDEPPRRNPRDKFVPINVGPDKFGSESDEMYIEELVGNAEKTDVKRSPKQPKPFSDIFSEPEQSSAEPEIPIDDIIKKAKDTKKKEKPADKAQTKTAHNDKKDEEPAPVFHTYQRPPLNCLEYANNVNAANYENEIKSNAQKLVDTLNSFGVSTKIVGVCRGPAVTRYELQPAAGVKISKITSLADDIALALAASGVRIEAPIPNKSAIGIEIPNKNRSTVSLREIIETPVYQNAKSKLNVALGKNITGDTICADIAKMPHLLIAGTTGSGKSVCLNSMIVSILYNSTPDEVKLLMIDPKQVEFTVYNGIPHLLVPVVSDPRKAAGALGWAVTEMLQRYKLFSENSVRDIKGYNKLAATSETITPMPHIVIFIDELSDLMMAAPNEVEDSICRLAQMARAAGMHLVIATQRPSVNVITGIIKANIPSRIALSVSSQVDSRTIIDVAGAEKLLGNGDMLFAPVGISKPVRVQGCFLSDEEVEGVVKFIKSQGEEKQYDEKVIEEIERQAAMEKKPSSSSSSSDSDSEDGGDELIPKAIEIVVEAQMASTTLLQRKLKLGYARAARIIDELEQRQIVGPFEGSKPRKVLVSKQQWLEMNALANASAPIENPIETEDEYNEDEEE